MNPFDKLCAGLAFLMGIVLLLLGFIGLFVGSSAHFSLPPILGGIPAIIGWGILRSVVIAWKCPPRTHAAEPFTPTEDEMAR